MSDIYTLIPKVMKDIGGVAKNRKNEQQKYSFRGIEDFYQAAHPAMITHGVFCAPSVLERDIYRFDKTNEYGKTTTWCHVAMKVNHRFYGPDGSFVDVVTWGEGLDNSDKASNKAMSGAMKYALIELFCVPTADVEDSDRTTPEAGTARKPVDVTTKPIPIRKPTAAAAEPLPPAGPVIYCGKDENKSFYSEFRKALSPNLQARTEEIGRAWLKNQGYVKDDGTGSLQRVDKAMFSEIMREATKYAQGLA